jgi:hypothetical protein
MAADARFAEQKREPYSLVGKWSLGAGRAPGLPFVVFVRCHFVILLKSIGGACFCVNLCMASIAFASSSTTGFSQVT